MCSLSWCILFVLIPFVVLFWIGIGFLEAHGVTTYNVETNHRDVVSIKTVNDQTSVYIKVHVHPYIQVLLIHVFIFCLFWWLLHVRLSARLLLSNLALFKMKGIKHGKALVRVSIGGDLRKADYVLVWATIMNLVVTLCRVLVCIHLIWYLLRAYIKRVSLFSGFSWGTYPSSKTCHAHWKYAEFQRCR